MATFVANNKMATFVATFCQVPLSNKHTKSQEKQKKYINLD